MSQLKFRKRGISLLAAASTCIGMSAHAQLEEVIVTAQKRAQSLQDVPMAVSAMGAAQLQDAGIQTLSDLSLHMPTLEVNTSTSPVSNVYRIRRLGNLANVPSVEPAVAIMMDGAFRGRPIFGAGDLYDVERIEVLRGPQSTLYGKNATAGVVSVHSAAPSDEFEWKAELTAGVAEGGAGDADLYSFKGGISGPLTDNLRGSLGVSGIEQDNAMGNGYQGGLGVETNENKRIAFRGQLVWDVTDSLSVRAILGSMDIDEANGTANDIYIDPTSPLIVGIPEAGLPPILATTAALAQGPAGLCADNNPDNNIGCNLTQFRTDVSAWEGTLLVNYQFENGWALDSITSWDRYEFDGPQDDVAQSSSQVLRYNPTQESESWQQELRLSSAGGEFLDWQAGIFYYHNEFFYGDKGDTPAFLHDLDSGNGLWEAILGVPWATPGQLGFLDGRQETDYLAFFGQGTFNFTDAFSLTGGARWQEEEKDMTIDQSVNDPSFSVISASLSPVAIGWTGGGDNRTSDEITWSLSPQYHIGDDTMLYATVSHGWKSGGFDIGFGAAPADDREFKDESLMHYELGVKTELWDNRVRLAASVFQTEIDDYQDPLFVGGQFVIKSVTKSELKGVELEGTALLTNRLTAQFAVSYVEFEFDEYTNGPCWPTQAPTGTDGGCDLSGSTPVNAPKGKASIGLTWEDDTSWGAYYFSGNVAYTDDYAITQAVYAGVPDQDSYSWVTLRAGTRWDKYELVAWVDNATNEEVVSFGAPLSLLGELGGDSYQTFLRAPRSYGLTFRVNY
jgi:iron complex outermembrane receptor protein